MTEQPDPGGTPPGARPISIAHLMATVVTAASHAVRHCTEAQHADSGEAQAFNMDHCSRHLADLVEHARKLAVHLRAHVPGVAEELDKLVPLSDPGSTAPVPARSAELKAYQETRARFAAASLYDGPG